MLGGFGEEFADFEAALAVALEFKWRWEGGAGFAFGAEIFGGERLAGVFLEGGFWVEGVDVRWAAVQEKMDDAFGFGREMRLLRREWIGAGSDFDSADGLR